MKKKLYILVPIFFIILAYIFLYARANEDYPRKSYIKEYSYKDTIDLDNVVVKIVDRKIENIGGTFYFLVNINYTSQVDEINIMKAGYIFRFYQDFTKSEMQNIKELERVNLPFEKTYTIDDFNISKGESKNFIQYYNVEDEGDFKNALLINPRIYKDIYEKEYENGSLYYEVIDLGDIYD